MLRLAAAVLLAGVGLLPASAPSASARTLDQIKSSGTLSVCLPTNSLPYSSRRDDPHGFQVELSDALAAQLGIGSVEAEWIVSPIQVRRAGCDLLLDVIADKEAQDGKFEYSRPYYRNGVALIVPPGSKVTSFAALDGHDKVAVQVGSLVAMILGERHVGLSMYAFEDEMLDAVAAHEVTAAAVTPLTAGYYNLKHPDAKLVILPPDEADQRLVWNIAVGMRRPDPALREAMDHALDKLEADGTIARIYGRYGITLQPPKP